MKIKFYFTLIATVCILLGIYFATSSNIFIFMYNSSNQVEENCTKNSDCDWVITNCCRETAGGLWDCVNMKTYKAPECQQNVICPQVFSPKPTADCICKEGSCVNET
jgi:hypothetical protein